MIDIEKLLALKKVEISFSETDVDSAYVKNFRKKHNLSQAALAEILDVSRRTVVNWEKERNGICPRSGILIMILNKNPELLEQLYKNEIK